MSLFKVEDEVVLGELSLSGRISNLFGKIKKITPKGWLYIDIYNYDTRIIYHDPINLETEIIKKDDILSSNNLFEEREEIKILIPEPSPINLINPNISSKYMILIKNI